MIGNEKTTGSNPKDLYAQLRRLSCERLWEDEVVRFEKANPQERLARVAVVRAVGVVFSESGTTEQKDRARLWLRGLLQDPGEKIRRYAMAALPKVGTSLAEETDLLSLLRSTPLERERKYLQRTLEKIGGAATLGEIGDAARGALLQTEQKVKASLARSQSPSTVNLHALLSDLDQVRIHLRGRRGLESIVRDELTEYITAHEQFRITEISKGLVAITPLAPFKLADIYGLRCFGAASFVLGTVRNSSPRVFVEALASTITSPLSQRLLETFTEGSVRYRLEFVSKGHQRAVVRQVANRAYEKCPAILNDARSARWTIAIYSTATGSLAELCPGLTPDPRFVYRLQDVPAASHPPLAACMARLAARLDDDIIWDPFCGSGLELIERALLGGVRKLYGTDRSPIAIAIAERNLAAANVPAVEARFACCDFREFAKVEGLSPNSVTLVITNPPLGKRVPIRNLPGLIADLFSVAATVLRPGGRLVFANPLRTERSHPSLKLQARHVVDFGGFDCRLELYVKTGQGLAIA